VTTSEGSKETTAALSKTNADIFGEMVEKRECQESWRKQAMKSYTIYFPRKRSKDGYRQVF
jgi:hypothetical protein